jgi:hypothetical protein
MPLIWQDIEIETFVPWINNLGVEIPWINNSGVVVLWRGVTAWTPINTQSFVPSGP